MFYDIIILINLNLFIHKKLKKGIQDISFIQFISHIRINQKFYSIMMANVVSGFFLLLFFFPNLCINLFF